MLDLPHTGTVPLPRTSSHLFILINYSGTVYQSIKVRNLIISTSATRQLLLIKQTSQGRLGDFLTLFFLRISQHLLGPIKRQGEGGEKERGERRKSWARWWDCVARPGLVLTEHSLFVLASRTVRQPEWRREIIDHCQSVWWCSKRLTLSSHQTPTTPMTPLKDKVGPTLWAASSTIFQHRTSYQRSLSFELTDGVTVNKSLTLESLSSY